MTWEEHAQQRERVPVTVVEIDLDWYDDVAIAATNDDGTLCYRTPPTTEQAAVPSPTLTVKTRRWMTSTQRPIAELGAIPCLKGARIQAEEIRIGRGLGSFGQVSIDLQDFTDDDRREDPFYSDTSRDAIDHSAGTYFSKLMARNLYWSGRPIRVIEGWATDGVWHEADAITRNYLVRDVQGPTNGKFKITAAGPLQLLNLNEREAPLASPCTLATDLTTSTSVVLLDPVEDVESYPASGYVRIGDEVISFTRVADELTMNRDGHFGTLPEEHQAGDTVQLCLIYTETEITEILRDLLVTYGEVPEELLALDEWESERALWLTLYDLSGIVSKPEKLMELIRELLESAGCIMWWDDELGKIRLRALRPANTSLGTWSDRFHLLKPIDIKRDLGERVSRCDVVMDMRSAANDPKELASYRIRVIGEAQGEAVTEHNSPQLHLVATRWFDSSDVPLALRTASQITEQLKDGRLTFQVEVGAKDAGRSIGDVIELLTKDIVDRNGAAKRTRCFVVKREAVVPGSRYRYTLEIAPFNGRFAFMTDTPYPDYDDATAEERDPGAFMDNLTATIPDPPYLMG